MQTQFAGFYVVKIDANGTTVWSKNIDIGDPYDPADVYANAISVNEEGNVFITGTFDKNIDFDPSPNETYIMDGDYSMFILKLDTDGLFQWAKSIKTEDAVSGPLIDKGINYVNSIETHDGNVYLTGGFEFSGDFDPGSGTTNLTAIGGHDIFILALDYDGNFSWVHQIGGPYFWVEEGTALTTDENGNIYVAGRFGFEVDFDPGPGVEILDNPTGTDIFIQKLDMNGDFLWVKQIVGYDFSVEEIKVDTDGNIYTTGFFEGTADFTPGITGQELTSIGETDIFIHKLDADGNFLWLGQIGSPLIEKSHSISTDANNNVYTTGMFKGTVDFDPSINVQELTSSGIGYNTFILKLTEGTVNTDNYETEFSYVVYPNPTDGQFSIAFEAVLTDIKIAIKDIKGRTLHSSFYEQADKIDLELNHPAGVYYLEVTTPDGVKAVPIIKK